MPLSFYRKFQLNASEATDITSIHILTMLDDVLLHKISQFWNLPPLKTIPGILPGGSPERVQQRAVCTDGMLQYALEGFPVGKVDSRVRQAKLLNMLQAEGCPALSPWLPTASGEYYAGIDGLFWQVRIWLNSDQLPRDDYGSHAWRGESAATMLIALQNAAKSLPPTSQPPFFLHNYIGQLMTWLKNVNARLIQDLLPITNELKDFFHAEHTLKLAFCHGDFHPFNILWLGREVKGLIDWEFCGIKPEAYDAANLLGCIGMDDPAWLTGPMAMAFIEQLKTANAFNEQTWRYLPDLMAALRFAWMREWANQKNLEMIIQELDYIWLLLDNRKLLLEKWNI